MDPRDFYHQNHHHHHQQQHHQGEVVRYNTSPMSPSFRNVNVDDNHRYLPPLLPLPPPPPPLQMYYLPQVSSMSPTRAWEHPVFLPSPVGPRFDRRSVDDDRNEGRSYGGHPFDDWNGRRRPFEGPPFDDRNDRGHPFDDYVDRNEGQPYDDRRNGGPRFERLEGPRFDDRNMGRGYEDGRGDHSEEYGERGEIRRRPGALVRLQMENPGLPVKRIDKDRLRMGFDKRKGFDKFMQGPRMNVRGREFDRERSFSSSGYQRREFGNEGSNGYPRMGLKRDSDREGLLSGNLRMAFGSEGLSGYSKSTPKKKGNNSGGIGYSMLTPKRQGTDNTSISGDPNSTTTGGQDDFIVARSSLVVDEGLPEKAGGSVPVDVAFKQNAGLVATPVMTDSSTQMVTSEMKRTVMVPKKSASGGALVNIVQKKRKLMSQVCKVVTEENSSKIDITVSESQAGLTHLKGRVEGTELAKADSPSKPPFSGMEISTGKNLSSEYPSSTAIVGSPLKPHLNKMNLPASKKSLLESPSRTATKVVKKILKKKKVAVSVSGLTSSTPVGSSSVALVMSSVNNLPGSSDLSLSVPNEAPGRRTNRDEIALEDVSCVDIFPDSLVNPVPVSSSSLVTGVPKDLGITNDISASDTNATMAFIETVNQFEEKDVRGDVGSKDDVKTVVGFPVRVALSSSGDITTKAGSSSSPDTEDLMIDVVGLGNDSLQLERMTRKEPLVNTNLESSHVIHGYGNTSHMLPDDPSTTMVGLDQVFAPNSKKKKKKNRKKKFVASTATDSNYVKGLTQVKENFTVLGMEKGIDLRTEVNLSVESTAVLGSSLHPIIVSDDTYEDRNELGKCPRGDVNEHGSICVGRPVKVKSEMCSDFLGSRIVDNLKVPYNTVSSGIIRRNALLENTTVAETPSTDAANLQNKKRKRRKKKKKKLVTEASLNSSSYLVSTAPDNGHLYKNCLLNGTPLGFSNALLTEVPERGDVSRNSSLLGSDLPSTLVEKTPQLVSDEISSPHQSKKLKLPSPISGFSSSKMSEISMEPEFGSNHNMAFETLSIEKFVAKSPVLSSSEEDNISKEPVKSTPNICFSSTSTVQEASNISALGIHNFASNGRSPCNTIESSYNDTRVQQKLLSVSNNGETLGASTSQMQESSSILAFNVHDFVADGRTLSTALESYYNDSLTKKELLSGNTLGFSTPEPTITEKKFVFGTDKKLDPKKPLSAVLDAKQSHGSISNNINSSYTNIVGQKSMWGDSSNVKSDQKVPNKPLASAKTLVKEKAHQPTSFLKPVGRVQKITHQAPPISTGGQGRASFTPGSVNGAISRARTWHRADTSPIAVPQKVPSLKAGRPQKVSPKKIAKLSSTTYIRKGNSLVRKDVPVTAHSQVSHGISTAANKLNPTAADERKTDTTELLKHVRVDIGTSKTLSIPQGTTYPNEVPNVCQDCENHVKLDRIPEASNINNSSKQLKLIPFRSPDVLLGTQVSSIMASDNYYKKSNNQLVRGIPEDSKTVGGQQAIMGSSIVRSRKINELGGKVTARPSKFSSVWTLQGAQSKNELSNSLLRKKGLSYFSPRKSTRSWRNFMYTSPSISFRRSSSRTRKFFLSQRNAVFIRSKGGFTLQKSKVGRSLKWSKSMEKQTNNSNEEANNSVDAPANKREQKGNAFRFSSARNRNISLQSSRERIFRIGSIRYKMDSSKQTLQRIPDEKSSCSAALQSKTDIKEYPIPKRLLIGNNEYVRVGNGNKLVRDPKKHVRILASEKVRRSLHTVRMKWAKKHEYCQFFIRFGKCNNGGKCEYVHDPAKVAVCFPFLNGVCSNTNCKLTHKVIPERMQDCSFYLQGLCSNKNCPFRHVNVNRKAPVCEGFLKGYCADGDECTKKHNFVCPQFQATGVCPQRSTCKLQHPSKQKKGTLEKGFKVTKNIKERYFGSLVPLVGSGQTLADATENVTEKNDETFFREGKSVDYIDISISEEDQENADLDVTTHTSLSKDELLDVEPEDLHELIHPIRVMNRAPK